MTPKIWKRLENRNPYFLIKTIYERQIVSSKSRGHPPPDYDLEWLNNWVLSQDNFQELFDEWVASECRTVLIPSVDRFNDNIGYTKENLHKVMTWQDNKLRGELLRSKGISKAKNHKEVHQFDLQGNYIKTYHSARNAYISLGAKISTHIIEVCTGRRNIAEGFIWSFDREGRDVLSKINNTKTTLKGKAICGYKDTEYIEAPNGTLAKKLYNIQTTNIQKCLRGERHTAGGYHWRYLDEYILEVYNDIFNDNLLGLTSNISHRDVVYNEESCLVSINLKEMEKQ